MKNKSENKSVLNKECSKVLNVITKNADITATKIQKRLRWGFIPTRALGFLRNNKFVTVNEETKGYTVNADGAKALAGYVAPKRRKVKTKSKKVKTIKTEKVKTGLGPVVALEQEPIAAELLAGVL